MERLRDLQDRFWAEAKHAVLVVLQGIDAAGKDGTIAKVMEAFNPQGCPVTVIQGPDAGGARPRLPVAGPQARRPRKGEIGIFNRSHYEDVLVVRVHELVPRKVWSKRYDQINDFERTLAESGTTIVKFFLHIDRDEQRQRLQDRYDDPTQALEVQHGRSRGAQALGRLPGRVRRGADEDARPTWAPWYVIPANRKWFRNLAVATILADTIDGAEAGLSEAARTCRRTSSSSRALDPGRTVETVGELHQPARDRSSKPSISSGARPDQGALPGERAVPMQPRSRASAAGPQEVRSGQDVGPGLEIDVLQPDEGRIIERRSRSCGRSN